MRLNTYLSEDILNPEQIKKVTILDNSIPLIKKTIKPWLSIIKSYQLPIFRGIKNNKRVITRQKVRINRLPKDTSRTEHDVADKAFQAAFGWKPRSTGLFVTPDPTNAGGYGEVKLAFPIGKTKYLWSDKIRDLYMFLHGMKTRRLWGTGHFEPDEDYKDYILHATPEQLKVQITDKYKTTGITKTANINTEIMLSCEEYWALDAKTVILWVHWKELIDTYPTIVDKNTYRIFIKEALLK